MDDMIKVVISGNMILYMSVIYIFISIENWKELFFSIFDTYKNIDHWHVQDHISTDYNDIMTYFVILQSLRSDDDGRFTSKRITIQRNPSPHEAAKPEIETGTFHAREIPDG